jgi:uncharacterized protein (TIGR00730 family)
MKNLIKLIVLSGIVLMVYSCSPKAEITIHLNESTCKTKGRIVPDGEIPTPEDLAKDAYCAKKLIERTAPNGVITIFGSARAKENMQSYINTREFAKKWTKAHGDKFPVLTGGGPGIMEAGNRGAKEAGGKSLSFNTYFVKGIEDPNEYVTDGFMFASFSQREADMVDYAAGVIIAPGGVGTSWEIYETLSKIQTRKKNYCPVILLGSREVWKPLLDHMDHLKKLKTISPKDVNLLQLAETPEKAIELLKKDLIK